MNKYLNKPSIKINAVLNIIRQLSTVLFPLITFPYVTRILQTKNYGLVNYSSSINSYFALVAALGFSIYAVREGAGLRDKTNEFNEFANQIFTLNTVSTIISLILEIVFLLIWNGISEYKILILIFVMLFLSKDGFNIWF